MVSRQEEWGRVVLDCPEDALRAEVRLGAPAPRITRPLSITYRLTGRSSRLGVAHRRSVLDRLRAAGFLRLCVVGLEWIPRGEAVDFLQAAQDRGLGVVALAGDCTEDLMAIAGSPPELGLQVLFEFGHVWRCEGEPGMDRRLEILQRLSGSGLPVRVLTRYDFKTPWILSEVGERIDRAGIQRWRICPLDPRPGKNLRLSDTALEDIRELRRDLPWLEVEYGNFIERELSFLINPNDEVTLAMDPGRAVLQGHVDQLADGTLLPPGFLDRHASLWLSEVIEYEESEPGSTGVWPTVPEFPEASGHAVFLCYKRLDKVFVHRLCRRLKEAGVSVWSDHVELRGGDHWRKRIEAAMEECRVVVVCIGPSGLGNFQEHEVSMALDLLTREQLKGLIPVLLPGVRDDSKIPALLRTRQYVDLRRESPEGFYQLLDAIASLLTEDINMPSPAAVSACREGVVLSGPTLRAGE